MSILSYSSKRIFLYLLICASSLELHPLVIFLSFLILTCQLSIWEEACVGSFQILETKLEVVDQFVIMQCLGPAYDGFFYLPASDTRGGIFVAWDSTKVQLTNFVNDTNFITGYVTPVEGSSWSLTVVYGP